MYHTIKKDINRYIVMYLYNYYYKYNFICFSNNYENYFDLFCILYCNYFLHHDLLSKITFQDTNDTIARKKACQNCHQTLLCAYIIDL